MELVFWLRKYLLMWVKTQTKYITHQTSLGSLENDFRSTILLRISFLFQVLESFFKVYMDGPFSQIYGYKTLNAPQEDSSVLHHSWWRGWSTITGLIRDKATRCRYLDGSGGTLNASGLGLYQTLPGRGWKLSNCYLCLLFGRSTHLYCSRAHSPFIEGVRSIVGE